MQFASVPTQKGVFMDTAPLSKKRILCKLFLSTLYISAFTFGGGFVIVTLMKKKFVDELHWITEEEMLDMTAIAQSSPGAIAVNASILVGFQVSGFAGAAVAIAGTILPPLVILSVISFFYTAFRDHTAVQLVLGGMQAGVAAVICDVVINLGKNVVKEKSLLSIFIMAAAFLCTYFLKVNAILIILAAGAIGILRAFLVLKGGKAK